MATGSGFVSDDPWVTWNSLNTCWLLSCVMWICWCNWSVKHLPCKIPNIPAVDQSQTGIEWSAAKKNLPHLRQWCAIDFQQLWPWMHRFQETWAWATISLCNGVRKHTLKTSLPKWCYKSTKCQLIKQISLLNNTVSVFTFRLAFSASRHFPKCPITLRHSSGFWIASSIA